MRPDWGSLRLAKLSPTQARFRGCAARPMGGGMLEFSRWLEGTSLSEWIRVTDWIIPFCQSVHIAAVAVVFGSVFMIDLRILGLAGRSQTLRETNRRFAPWFWGGLAVLLATGSVLVIGEPVRSLMTVSFRVKMILIVVGAIIGGAFIAAVQRRQISWGAAQSGSARLIGLLVLLLWITIIVLGRFIAWDPDIFGDLSPYPG